MRFIGILAVSIILGYSYSVFLTGCAQVQPLTGGERDTIPPQLDTARSTANFQTRFEKQPILLFFDEFVDLKDVFNQVVVSPPLAKRPKVTVEKYRRVRFEFDPEEALRPDATYSIQFGDAIKDYTEGNAAPIRFVFSTGDKIDSLKVSGRVVDAFTGKPVEKVLVMLYDNLADSVVRKERPFYFSKTDKQGAFRIENVKSDTFKIFALEDANLNYLFDQTTERIGFQSQPVATGDSLQVPIEIRFFQETPPLALAGQSSPLSGLVKLTFTREPWDMEVQTTQPVFFEERKQDTIYLWHDIPDSVYWRVLMRNEEWADSAVVRPPARGQSLQKLLPVTTSISQNPSLPAELAFNYPLTGVVLDSVQVWQDTLRIEAPLGGGRDSLDFRTLAFRFGWEENTQYRLLFPPGSLNGWKNTTNDSIWINLRTAQRNDFGALNIRLDSLDTGAPLAVELMQQEKVLDRYLIPAGSEFWEKKLPFMPPGSYQLRVIEDLNGNGRWDPGRYDKGLQPERLQTVTLEQLRANWEVEAKFVVKW